MSSEAFIVDAVRTPRGRIGGALAGVRPDDLLAGVVRRDCLRTLRGDVRRDLDVYLRRRPGGGGTSRAA